MFKNIYSFKLPLASLWRTSTANLQYSLLCICLRLGHTCDNIKLQGSQDASAQQTARTSPLRGVNRLKNNHLGANNSHTTRAFNLTCSHLRWILHSMHVGPGWWNNQTSMVRNDKFITGVCGGCLLQDNDFELLDYDCLGNVTSVEYKGVYVIVGNGYLQWQWSCTDPHLPSPVIWMRFAGPND
jgi:hypothetical protein